MSSYGGKTLPDTLRYAMQDNKWLSKEMYFAFENMFYAGLVLASSSEIDNIKMGELMDLKVRN